MRRRESSIVASSRHPDDGWIRQPQARTRAALGLSWIGLQSADSVAAIREELAPRHCTVLDGAADGQWPADGPGQVVMERLKAGFDPARIFRPGSFVGGI